MLRVFFVVFRLVFFLFTLLFFNSFVVQLISFVYPICLLSSSPITDNSSVAQTTGKRNIGIITGVGACSFLGHQKRSLFFVCCFSSPYFGIL